MVYIALFGLEKSIIGSRFLPDLIFFTGCYDVSPFGSKAQKRLHLLNKGTTTHGDTVRPFLVPGFLPGPQANSGSE